MMARRDRVTSLTGVGCAAVRATRVASSRAPTTRAAKMVSKKGILDEGKPRTTITTLGRKGESSFFSFLF